MNTVIDHTGLIEEIKISLFLILISTMSLNDLLLELDSISASPGFSSPPAPTSGGVALVDMALQEEAAVSTGTKVKAHGLLFVGVGDLEGVNGYCFGVIGQGGTFCVKRGCVVAVHRTTKFKATPESLYVLKNAESAFVEPVVATNKLEDSLLESWLSERASFAEWRKRFGLVNSSDEGALITKAEMERSEDIFARAKDFKTPAKRRREEEDEAKMLQLQFSPYRKQVKEPKTVLLASPKNPSFSAQWLRILIELDEFADHVGDTIQGILADRDKQGKGNASLFALLNTKIDHVAGMLGSTPHHLSEQFDAPTIWGAIAEIAGQVDSLIVHKCEEETLESQIAFFAKSSTFCGLVVKIIGEAILPQLKEGINARVSEETFVRVSHALTSRLREQAENLSTLTARLQRLETFPTTRGGGMPASGHSEDLFKFLGLDSKSTISTPGEDQVVEIAKRLSQVETQVRGLIAESTDSAISFAGLGFRSQVEVQAWVAVELKTHSFGLFPDVYTLLDWIYAASDAEDTLLTRLEKLHKLKIESGAEARAMNAFENKIPRILHKGKGSLIVRGGESHLTNIPTYDAWWNNGMGMKDRLHDDITTVEEGFKNLIADRLESGSKAYSIASLALKESITWLMELINFIDETYESLVRSKFSSAAGWSLTTKLVARIFTDLATVRGGVNNAFTPGDSASITANVLWGVFKTHDVMAQFRKQKFKNHTSISSEYVKFLATHSAHESVTKLEDKIKSLEADLKVATKQAAEASKAAATSSNHANELKTKMAALERRLGKLEERPFNARGGNGGGTSNGGGGNQH